MISDGNGIVFIAEYNDFFITLSVPSRGTLTLNRLPAQREAHERHKKNTLNYRKDLHKLCHIKSFNEIEQTDRQDR